MMNWRVYDYEEGSDGRVSHFNTASNAHNTFANSQIFQTTKGDLDAEGVRPFISEVKHLPCRCIMPDHEDKSPSAFVREKEGNVMFHCSSCDVTLFNE